MNTVPLDNEHTLKLGCVTDCDTPFLLEKFTSLYSHVISRLDLYYMR